MLADAGGWVEEVIRVTPASHEKPVYLVERVAVPNFPPEANGLGWLSGGFDLGPGRYQVDWMMHDSGGRGCSARWNLNVKLAARERNVALTLRENTVAARIAAPFDDEPRTEGVEGQPLSVKILLNLSPTRAQESLLRPQYAAVLLSILRSIVRESGGSRLTLVAFNLRAQKIVYQQDDVEQIDFAALAKALQTPAAGTIDYRLLQDRRSEAHFVTNLLIDQLGSRTASQDAIVIVGPKVSLKKSIPRNAPGGRCGALPDLLPELQPQPVRGSLPRDDRLCTESLPRCIKIRHCAPS